MKTAVAARPLTITVTMTCLLAVVAAGLSCSGTSGTLSVFAAAGAKPAFDKIAAAYAAAGSSVDISYGGGGEVLTQMMLSKSGDIYVAPEQGFMEKAVAGGVVDPATVRTVAWMVPVIAVAEGNPLGIATLDDLVAPGVRVGITREETTLLGRYAPEIFEKAGLTAAIRPNIVTEAARPDSLVTALAMGQLDAAIIWDFYGTRFPDDIDIVPLAPDRLTGIGELQVAVATWCRDTAAAERFIQLLVSPEGKGLLREAGYLTDENEARRWQP
jgi:molybdate transport system substrate-binding protein